MLAMTVDGQILELYIAIHLVSVGDLLSSVEVDVRFLVMLCSGHLRPPV